MKRILWGLLIVVTVAPTGCNHGWLRSRRDDTLLAGRASSAWDPCPCDASDSPLTIPLSTEPPMVFSDRRCQQDATLTLPEALFAALGQSEIFRVATAGNVTAAEDTFYDLDIAQQRVTAALSEFDASFAAEFYTSRINQPPDAFFGPGLTQPDLRDEALYNFSLSKPLIRGGQAVVSYNPDPSYLFIPDADADSFNPAHVGRLELELTQPLLRGAGLEVNRVPIRISQIAANQSAWDFKKTAMAAVRSVIVEYWELHAAHVAMRSIDEVIPLLEEVVRLQEEAYKTQWVIQADVAKAHARLHEFRQERVRLEARVVASELRLRRLMNLPPVDGRNLIPVTNPTRHLPDIVPNESVRSAMLHNPDLVRQRLDIRIRELELFVAENNLQPQFDLRALYRMNGVGEDLGTALHQLASVEFSDWLLGATFSVPLGRRQATAGVRRAELKLIRGRGLLDQASRTMAHRVSGKLREIDFAWREHQEAERRLRATHDWLRGARLRYQNPNPDAGGGNWLLQNLNDYLDALRARTDAAADAAEVLSRYNAELVRLHEMQGTILGFFGIELSCDPCGQIVDATHVTLPAEDERVPESILRDQLRGTGPELTSPRSPHVDLPPAPDPEVIRLPPPDATGLVPTPLVPTSLGLARYLPSRRPTVE